MLFRQYKWQIKTYILTHTHIKCNARNMFYVNKYNEKPTSIKVLTVFKRPTLLNARAHTQTHV